MKDAWTGIRLLFLVMFAVVVSACAEVELGAHVAKRITSTTEDIPSPRYKVGDPYNIQGIWYYPAEDFEYEETGIASWYGLQFHGKKTANGGTYDMNALTAAHRTLPMPSFVRVTNLENGRSLILKVNDRGPFAKPRHRIIDISRRGAQLLGFQKAGTARVRVQIMADKSRALAHRIKGRTQLAQIGTPITVDRLPKPDVKTESLALPPGGQAVAGRVQPPSRAPSPAPRRVATNTPQLSSGDTNVVTMKPVKKTNLFIQAGAFGRFDNANRVRARLTTVGPVKISSVLVKGRDLYRVRVGPLSNVAEADWMLNTVIRNGYPAARIIVE